MRTRVLLVAGLLAIAVVIAATLAPAEPRRSGTNNVPPTGTVARVAPGAELCQAEDVPEQTRIVGLRVEAIDGLPPFVVRLEGPGGESAAGRATRQDPEGFVRVKLRRAPTPGSSEVCVRNRGTRPLPLVGFATGEASGPITVEYYRAGRESWWQLASVVADRFSLGKSGLLPAWSLWLAVSMLLVALTLTATALWRIGRSE